MESSSAAGDAFAWVFLLILFGVLFSLPFWLIYRHYKKNKPKIAAEKAAYEKLPDKTKRKNKIDGYSTLFGLLTFVAGLRFGVVALESRATGVLIGVVAGSTVRYLVYKLMSLSGTRG